MSCTACLVWAVAASAGNLQQALAAAQNSSSGRPSVEGPPPTLPAAFLPAAFAQPTSSAQDAGDTEGPNVQGLFQGFIAHFGKTYADEEHEARFVAFQESLRVIREHNAKATGSFRLGLNEHADLTRREFVHRLLGLDASLSADTDSNFSSWPDLMEAASTLNWSLSAAESVDWVSAGAVTRVKDQGQCGSCWAFTASSALSAAWQIATGKLVELSQQQFMDCVRSSHGCNGGLMTHAYQYAMRADVCTLDTYPYEMLAYMCRRQGCSVGLPLGAVVGFRAVRPGSEEALLAAVLKQPVGVGIEAEQSVEFRLYKEGVMSKACGFSPNHGVLVVGFGTEGANPYWFIQNSWGATWGEAGYFRLLRGPGLLGSGECGILTMPSYPVVRGEQGTHGTHAASKAGRKLPAASGDGSRP